MICYRAWIWDKKRGRAMSLSVLELRCASYNEAKRRVKALCNRMGAFAAFELEAIQADAHVWTWILNGGRYGE